MNPELWNFDEEVDDEGGRWFHAYCKICSQAKKEVYWGEVDGLFVSSSSVLLRMKLDAHEQWHDLMDAHADMQEFHAEREQCRHEHVINAEGDKEPCYKRSCYV